MTLEVALRNVSIFQGLTEDLLAELVQIGKSEQWEANATVYSEGDASESLYIIRSGSAQVSRKVNGGKEITLAKLQGGEFFGELALVGPSLRAETVSTISGCEFFIISRKRFEDLLSQCPRLIPFVLNGAISKGQTISEQFLQEVCEKQKLQEEIVREQYSSISQIAAAANDAETPEQAFRIVLDLICTYINWPIGHVYTVGKGTI